MNQQVKQVKNIGEILLITEDKGSDEYKQNPKDQVIDPSRLKMAVEDIE